MNESLGSNQAPEPTRPRPAAPQVPRPLPRDRAKWAAAAGLALRFEARLLPPHLCHFEPDRVFVATFHLEDDTLSVFEPPRRNSGLPGGAFAERARARRPGGGPLDCYGPGDMLVTAAAARGGGRTGIRLRGGLRV